MASEQIVVINQLASRLENATSTERIDALQELQSHAKVNPEIVGSLSLKKVLDFLQEQGSAEEYQEALDLIYRLVKCRDKNAAISNSNIILGDVNAVELLLDLLNHEDLTVGVMTSQILTEIHGCNGPSLELQIQQCPDGMNKLLQRLPDSSREEVRNQAIVLIQQLTSTNEEMKKTVVFNEGFEILFGIIQREGGFEDAGLVVQDCLFICNNILSDSETCQRLFFAMGSDWILRLADFFDPSLLESLDRSNFSLGIDDDDDEPGAVQSEGWFDDPARLACAVLALTSLYRSLSTPNKKHQNVLATSTSIVIPSAAFWIARRGPSELVNAGLSLLSRLVDGHNVDVANLLANSYIKVTPPVPRKNFPSDTELPQLVFGWKPLPGDDRKFISILSLLAERYIYPASAWNPRDGTVLGAKLNLQFQVLTEGEDNLAQSSLLVLEQILASDPSISDLLVQYVLAPPPPPHLDGASEYEDDPHSQQLESMRPLGLQVLSLLVDGCNKILDGSSRAGFEVAERSANVLAVVFIHGSQLAKEIFTAVTTSHIGNGMGKNIVMSSHAEGHKAILPLLLFTAGRIARTAGGAGYPLLISFLRLLACVVSDCERAAKQVLEDPGIVSAVMDLATTTSESAGVPVLVQIAASWFLGCCFEALPAPVPAASTPPPSSNGTNQQGSEDNALTRKSFLNMIDQRVGLSRFTDLLKKPLAAAARPTSKTSTENYSSLFISPDFQTFYQKQVEGIRAGIFEYYTGSADAAPGDAAQQAVIEMQRERIAELEQRLAAQVPGPVSGVDAPESVLAPVPVPVVDKSAELAAALETIRHYETTLDTTAETELRLQEDIRTLESSLEAKSAEVDLSKEACAHLDSELRRHALELEVVTAKCLHAEEASHTAQKGLAEALERAHHGDEGLQAELAAAQATILAHTGEVLALKQTVVTSHQENKQLKENLEQRDRKIELLVGELHSSQPVDKQAEKKVADLEERNAELKAQMWAIESELRNLQEKQALAPPSVEVPEVMTDVSLVTSPERQGNGSDPSFERVADAALSLVRLLGISEEVNDFMSVEETLREASADSAEKNRLVEELLVQCRESLNGAVNECSDIAEAAGIQNLEGDEGSVLRFLDCCHKLRESAVDAADAEQQLIDSERIIGDLSEQVRVLEDQLESAINELKEVSESAEASADLEAQLEEAQRSVAELGEQVCHMEQQLGGSVAEAARMKALYEAAQASDLEGKLAEANHQIDELSEQVRVAEAHLEESVSEAARYKELHQTAQAKNTEQQVVDAQTEADRLQEELLRVQADLDAATAKISLQTSLIESFHIQTSDSSALLETLNAERAKAATERQDLTTQLHALEAELQTAQAQTLSTSSECNTLRTELAELQVQLDTAVAAAAESSKAEVACLHERLTIELAESVAQCTALREEMDTLIAAQRDADSAAAVTIADLQAALEEAQRQVEQETANAMAKDQALAASMVREAAAQAVLAELEIELEAVKLASNQSTEEIRTELERVRHELTQKEHQLAATEADIQQLQSEAAAQLEQLENALQEKFESERTLFVAEAEQQKAKVKESLEQQLVDAWGEMGTLNKSTEESLAQAAAERAAEQETWQSERSALLQQVADAAAQLAGVARSDQHSVATLTALCAASEGHISTLQNALDASSLTCGVDVVAYGLLRAQLSAAEDVIAQLEGGYSSVAGRCAAVEADNAVLAEQREVPKYPLT